MFVCVEIFVITQLCEFAVLSSNGVSYATVKSTKASVRCCSAPSASSVLSSGLVILDQLTLLTDSTETH